VSSSAELQTSSEEKKSDVYGLSQEDIEYISALLTSSERGVAGLDEEAAVERINEAFSENFGDIVLEHDGEKYVVIEDYTDDVSEWLSKFE
jgi:hypothetical protein